MKHLFLGFIFIISACLCLTSCKDKEILGRLDKVEANISEIQSSINELKSAYADGKVIKSVQAMEGSKGWIITYSDGSTTNIYNGADGVTPYVKSDNEGYWIVSYDNGQTFQLIVDEHGNKIKAVGKDGEEGMSVRIAINSDSKYVIQTYKESNPKDVVSETVTPYTADASRVISKIEQDKKTNTITITLADGSTLKFNTFIVFPTSISILNTKALKLNFGTQTSIEFRINPSNANIYMGETIEDCPIELDKVGSTKASYVTKPINYKLVSVEYVYNEDTQELKHGQYRAIIEDTRKGQDYDEMVALVLNYKDGNNDDVQLSSSAFEIIGKKPEFLKTGLPVCYLNTPNAEPITSKETWIEGSELTIVNTNGDIEYQGTLSVKGRGNTTWNYPKKPYNLKLDKASKMFGMESSKKWALLANYIDRTLLRNDVSFEIFRKTDLAWTPSGQYVELVLNGTHVGNYYLCEKIEISKNRLNITKASKKDTDPDLITGGYIFELDKYFDEDFKFMSSIKKLPYMFSDPDEVNNIQQAYVENYVTEMEQVLTGADNTKDIEDYMNLESYVDWWMATELTGNREPAWPKSCYMHKDYNGKMTAGPAWDYDWGTFVPARANIFTCKGSLYYPELFKNQKFVSLLKSRWPGFKQNVLNDIPTFIEDKRDKLKLSDELNITMWPINENANGDENMSFDEAIDRLKSSLLNKLNWLDTQIQSL